MAHPLPAPNDSHPGRILVVDDVLANRELLAQELEDEGFEVETAESGPAGLELAQRWHPEVILLDIQMPGMDGIETCRKLKERPDTRDIPVLFVTANRKDDASEVAALKAGGNDFLPKPYSPPILFARVSSQLAIARAHAKLRQMAMVLDQARRMLRETFGRYVSEEVAQAVLEEPEGTRIGGESREVTILFSDLRSFSTICEALEPEKVVSVLNEYFGAMSEIIDAERGCVIEFLGDAILAVFGAPNALPDHATRAVRVAARMRRRTDELNREWDASGASEPWKSRGIPQLAARIGLHSGQVVAGNLGSHTRVKYAVVGDAVNTASRVEHLNNALGTDVLLTEAVYLALPEDLARGCEDRGEHRLKGKEAAVRAFALGPAAAQKPA